MLQLDTIHNEAMAQVELALMARANGDNDRAISLFREAFVLESDAARHVPLDMEPTRSVFLRSAAALALECNELREAEKLIGLALYGDPPQEIADELRDLLETVHFSRHLELRGLQLTDDEFQMSIAGTEVGHGIAPQDEVIDRVSSMEKLIYRTFERKAGKPFRASGGPSKQVLEGFGLYVTTLRAASMAWTLRIAQPGGQQTLTLDGSSKPADVIEDILMCFDLYANDQDDKLKSRIGNDDYYSNFIGLAKRISPDGERVNLVGFTAVDHGQEKRVILTRQKPTQKHSTRHTDKSLVSIEGTLLFADSTKSTKGAIKIIDDTGKQHNIEVPTAMMDDIVKPLWNNRVIVKGRRSRKRIILSDIDKA